MRAVLSIVTILLISTVCFAQASKSVKRNQVLGFDRPFIDFRALARYDSERSGLVGVSANIGISGIFFNTQIDVIPLSLTFDEGNRAIWGYGVNV